LNDGVMADDANLLLDALRAHYRIEEDRSQSFNNRGASLAALGSVVLSLLTFAVSNDVRPDTTAASSRCGIAGVTRRTRAKSEKSHPPQASRAIHGQKGTPTRLAPTRHRRPAPPPRWEGHRRRSRS
jgi:hypothetical protein